MKNRRRKKFNLYLKKFVVKFSRITKFVIFREDLISRIAHFEIFRVDLISRIYSLKPRNLIRAKINPLKVPFLTIKNILHLKTDENI